MSYDRNGQTHDERKDDEGPVSPQNPLNCVPEFQCCLFRLAAAVKTTHGSIRL